MSAPIALPNSPKRVLIIGSDGVTRLEEQLPIRPCGIFCGAFPVVILLRSMEQARHVQNALNSWLPRIVRMTRPHKALLEDLAASEGLKRISEDVSRMSEGYKGFYLDVRSGRRSAVFCCSREALLSMSLVKLESRQAFVFATFRDAVLSAFMWPGGAPDHCIYDFNPSIQSPQQAETARAIASGIPPGAGTGCFITGPPRPPPAVSASQDPEITLLMHAMETSFGWAHYYLHTHGFGADVSWIQDRFDLSKGLEQFVEALSNRFGEGRFAEYTYIYYLFQEL
ncbi:hypothetical protein V5O48_013377 [Marasmius crinis-equi]|uniref:Uncharacterized protein n=1 Tax=Marasmius crinis-equi TaxID=585013 RepID=A0ABR3F086_9AGAR